MINATVTGPITTPTEGNEYTLTCTVSGHQSLMTTVTYQWLKNSNILPSETGGRLIFNPVDRYDNGTYTCRVTISSQILNNETIIMDSATLHVTGILKNWIDSVLLCLHILVKLPAAPDVQADIIQRPTSISLSWTQPSSGSYVDSYTVQYSASVRGCNPPSQKSGNTSINSTLRNFTITGLEEDSDVSVTIAAVNIRGSNSALVTTNTLTASI